MLQVGAKAAGRLWPEWLTLAAVPMGKSFKKQKQYNRWMNAVCMLAGSILLMYQAFYNKFPLVYPDTGIHISSGMEGFVPYGRPITYGLFIWLSSFSISLWSTIFIQSLLLSIVLFTLVKEFIRKPVHARVAYGLSMLILVLCTGLSFHSSQLLPDIYTPLLILTLGLMLWKRELSLGRTAWLGALLVFSSMVHNAHLLIALLLLIGTTLIAIRYRSTIALHRNRLLMAWAFVLFSWLALPTVNALHGEGFRLSKGAHAFLVFKTLENGLLEDFLANNCEEDDYNLCAYQNQFFVDFLWDAERSPFYKTGGWEANEEEYNRLLRDLLSNPKYLSWYALNTVESTGKQLFSFEMGDAPALHAPQSPYVEVKKYYRDSLREYLLARQSLEQLDYRALNNRQELLVFISLFGLIVLLSFARYRRHFTKAQLELIVFTALGLLANALATSALAATVERYQSRVIWIIPLLFLIMLCRVVPRHTLWQRYFPAKAS